MQQLFGIIYKGRNFLLFLLLEALSFVLIKNNNIKWDISFFNSSNAIAAKTMDYTYEAKAYLKLQSVNESLANENKRLNKLLSAKPTAASLADSTYLNRFNYELALVVNNGIGLTKNYLTLNKGKVHGIKPGMAVLGPDGIVGQVMKCSDHFSTVYSVLHVDFKISAEITSEKLGEDIALGVANWDARSHRTIKLQNIDKFKNIAIGDTVVTSSQNLIFPAGVPIGRVNKVIDKPSSAFWDIDVTLSSDLNGLRYVYIIENKLSEEQLKLEIQSKEE